MKKRFEVAINVARAASHQRLVSIPNSHRASLDRHPHIVSSSSFFVFDFLSVFSSRPSLPSFDSFGFLSRRLDTSFHSLPCRISRHHLSHYLHTASTARLSYSFFFSSPSVFTPAGWIHPVVARPSVCLDPGREERREGGEIRGEKEDGGQCSRSLIPGSASPLAIAFFGRSTLHGPCSAAAKTLAGTQSMGETE